MGRGKKYIGIVKKLKSIYPEFRNKIMSEYYEAQSKKFSKLFRNWFKQILLNLINSNKVQSPTKPSYKNEDKIITKIPKFKFKPTNDELNKIIYKAIEKNIF